MDGALAGVEHGVRQRKPAVAVGALAALGALLAAGLALPVALSASDDRPVVVVGSKAFTEQYVLARLIADRLDRAGFAVDARDSLGSTVLHDALVGGEVHVAVDYSGTLWAQHLKRTETADAQTVIREVCRALEGMEVACVGALGFENAYGLAVRRAQAEAKGWRTVSDLTADAGQLTIGSDFEFFQRAEWTAVREAYGLSFGSERSFDPTFLYEAARTEEADVITAYTSDGRISAFDLVVLDDTLGALPPYDALLLVSKDAPAGVAEALTSLVGAIDVEAMRKANRAVDVDGQTPEAAARAMMSDLSP